MSEFKVRNTTNFDVDKIDMDEKCVEPPPIQKKPGNFRGNLIKIALGEFLGTAMLVFITCLGCTFGLSGDPVNISSLQLSLTSGLSVMTVIQSFAHISGAHVNPAVTLCAFLMDQIAFSLVPLYVVCQFLGSLSGYAIVMAATPSEYFNTTYSKGVGHCVTRPNGAISSIQAILVELMVTLVMCLGICAAWDQKTGNGTVPVKIGLIVAVLVMAAGPYTGGSMNPIRSFAPAALNGQFTQHWVYWIGPIIGACIAGLVYRVLILRKGFRRH